MDPHPPEGAATRSSPQKLLAEACPTKTGASKDCFIFIGCNAVLQLCLVL